jgi:hypothetical protein
MLISVDSLVLYVGLGGFMWVVVEAWFGVICGVGWFCVNPPVQFLTNKRIFFLNECVTNWCSKLILYFQYIYFLIIKKNMLNWYPEDMSRVDNWTTLVQTQFRTF